MAKNNGYTTIYSDEDIVVLNKQSGILIAADRYNQEAPRLDLLAEKEFGRLYAVHRIDKDTSGIVIYARTAEAHKNLSQQFEKRQVAKTYHALVYGHPLWQELHVDLALQPDGDARHRTVVSKKYGKTAFRTVTINRAAWLKRVHNISSNVPNKTARLEYIPYDNLGNTQTDRPLVVIFVLDKSETMYKKTGTDLAVHHMGFLLPNGMLRHASSSCGGVVDVNFDEYVAKRKKMPNNLGVMLLEIK